MSEEEEDEEEDEEEVLGLRRLDVAELEEAAQAASRRGDNAVAERQYCAAVAKDPENALLLVGRAANRIAIGEPHAGKPPWISVWRCIHKRPKGRASVAVRKDKVPGSRILHALCYQQEFRVDGEPSDGWVKLLDSRGWAMVRHPDIGVLLEPVVQGPLAIDRALEDCERALQLQPRLADAYLIGARCLSVRGQLEEAEMFLNRGWGKVSMKQQHKLSVQLRNLQKIKPKLAEAEGLLAVDLEGEDRGKRALGVVKEAARLGAPALKTRPLLLRALLQSRDAARAGEALELSRELLESAVGTPDPEVRLWRGGALLLARECEEASAALRGLLEEASQAGADLGALAKELSAGRPGPTEASAPGRQPDPEPDPGLQGHGAAVGLSGEWEDEEGEVVVVDGCQMQGPDGTAITIELGSGGSFSFSSDGRTFEGSLRQDEILWSDGCTWVRRRAGLPPSPEGGVEWFEVVFKRVLVKKQAEPDAKSWSFLTQGQKVMALPSRAVDAGGRLWAELTPFQLRQLCQCDEDDARGFLLIDGSEFGLGQLLRGPLPSFQEDLAVAARTAAALLHGMERGPERKARGDELLASRRWDDALECYQACRPAASWDQALRASLHIGIAAALREMRETKDALRHATLAIQLDPSSGDAFFRRGVLHCDEGDWQQSLRDFQDAKRFSDSIPDLDAWLKRARRAKYADSGENKRKNYYWVLDLLCDCDIADVKKRFRQLALTCHPDKIHSASEAVVKSAEARFKAVNEAYNVLSSPEKRAAYDFGD